MAWVGEACGFFAKEQAGALKPTDVYLFRVAQMLNDFAVHGAVLRRYSRTVGKLTGGETDTLARFGGWLRVAGRAASTVRAYGTVAGEFLAFTGGGGRLSGGGYGGGWGVLGPPEGRSRASGGGQQWAPRGVLSVARPPRSSRQRCPR